jgi:hypothetical protein
MHHAQISFLTPAVATPSAGRSLGGVLVMNKSARFSLMTTAILVGTLYAGTWRAEADYIQTNLVSDLPGLAALTDPSLVNPWGSSHSATSPFWISNQGTNTSTLYAVTGSLNTTSSLNVTKFPPANPLTVAIPTTPPGGPPKDPKAPPARSTIQVRPSK